MNPEDALRRILWLMAALAIAGGVFAFVHGGWRTGAGFLLGALASWVNFRWLKQLVDALGGGKVRGRVALWLGARYVVLAIGAYAIVGFTSLSLPAALVGLFVAVAAVIVEILIELLYAR
jgi:hypothetical protein